MSTLVKGKDKFDMFSFKEEENFEKIVVKNANRIFGKRSVYFDVKKRIKTSSGIMAIPDGFLIDLWDVSSPTLYLVENELAKHDCYKHILPQVLKFVNVLQRDKETIKKIIDKEIEKDKSKKKRIESLIKKNYENIDKLIYNLVYNKKSSVLIVIDRKNKNLDEMVELISDFIDVKVIEVKTFSQNTEELDKNPYILFKPLNEETDVPSDEKIWYKLEMTNVERVEDWRSDFESKYEINKNVQGFVYVRDSSGKVTGIVIIWYRSNIRRHFEEESNTHVGTGRIIDVNNLKKGMDIYVMETRYDGQTGEKIEKPKVRIHGKLDKVFRIRGDKEDLIFPKEKV